MADRLVLAWVPAPANLLADTFRQETESDDLV
jgi:hypothetical protein